MNTNIVSDAAVEAIFDNLSPEPGRHVAVFVGGPRDGETTDKPLRRFELPTWELVDITDEYFARWPETKQLKSQGVESYFYGYWPHPVMIGRLGVWCLRAYYVADIDLRAAVAEHRREALLQAD